MNVLKEKQEEREILKKKLDVIVNEIKLNNTNLKQIINSLLCHYHTLLNEGLNLRKEGLVWAIKAIWNLGYDVVVSYFPNYLDQNCIKYLFKV